MLAMERDNFFQLTTAQLHGINALLPTCYTMEPNRSLHEPPSKRNRPQSDDIDQRLSEMIKEIRGLAGVESFMSVGAPRARRLLNIALLEDRVKSQDYASIQDFTSDVRKMLNQACQVIHSGMQEVTAVNSVSEWMERETGRRPVPPLDPPLEEPKEEVKREKRSRPKTTAAPSELEQLAMERSNQPLSHRMKQALAKEIMKLGKQYLPRVIEIVRGHDRKMSSECEFDVDKLPMEVCQELRTYVLKCTGKKELAQPQSSSGSESEDNSARNRGEKGKTGRRDISATEFLVDSCERQLVSAAAGFSPAVGIGLRAAES